MSSCRQIPKPAREAAFRVSAIFSDNAPVQEKFTSMPNRQSLFSRLVTVGLTTFLSVSTLHAGEASTPAATVQLSPTFQTVEPGLKAAMLPALYASSHASNLVLLANGDLICFWFSGTWEGDSGVGIVMSRLPKGSQTWQKTTLIDNEDGRSFQNPVGFEDKSGRLWLFHSSQPAKLGQATAVVMDLWSNDHGKTWTKPQVVFSQPGAFTRQPMVVMDDGAWLLPMFYTPSAGISKGAESHYSVMEISSDSGKHWRECKVPDSDGLVHPSVLKVGVHSYVAFFRSRFADWIYRATSTDGCTWTSPVKTSLPNNNASIQVTRLRNGHMVVAFNNSSGPEGPRVGKTGPRVPLSVALSEDNGVTWTAVRDLERGDPGSNGEKHFPAKEGRDEFSYPAILQIANGNLVVSYTYRRTGIKVVEFKEGWIKGGTSNGKFNALTKN
jgi:predicted neuraminidase